MTSSLVGSEMCIRDRPETSPPFPLLLPLGHPLTARPVRRSGALRSPIPVSYTHLTLPTICSV
eukprot:194246-Prorocentrum_lima.AAC.1